MNETTATKPTILVTGCSGLIGSTLIKALHNDFQIIGLDLDAPEQLPEGVRWIQCDLTEDDSVAASLAEANSLAQGTIASVIHLAAYYDFSGDPSPLYDKLTVEGTRRLLRGLQAMNVEQFVFASTLLLMKSAAESGKPISEDSPVEAEWDYPQSKVKAEAVIQQEHGKIPAVILRVAGVFNEEGNSLPITQQIKRIYEKEMESHFFPGDSSHGQAFIHLDDLTACFEQVIAKREALPDYEVFLIAEDDLMSYQELQDTIGKLVHGDNWTTLRIPKVVAKAGAWFKGAISSDDDQPFIKPWMVDLADQHYPVDVSKARRVLDWKPQHTLRGTLPAMAIALKRDPQRFYELNGLPMSQEMHDS
jgi:nucleoside-diphosphate-sugar epimerase